MNTIKYISTNLIISTKTKTTTQQKKRERMQYTIYNAILCYIMLLYRGYMAILTASCTVCMTKQAIVPTIPVIHTLCVSSIASNNNSKIAT